MDSDDGQSPTGSGPSDSGERDPSLAAQNLELRRLHDALELSTRKYKNLFELAPVGYLFLSAGGEVREANLATAALFAQPRSLLVGSNVQLLVRNEDQELVREHLLDVCDSGAQSIEVRALQSDGRQVPVSIRSTAIRNARGGVAGVHMALMDITDHMNAKVALQRARDHLHHLAHHDPLTDLPNRLLFSDRLHQAVLRACRRLSGFALLFIDLDRFKFINDSLGHQVGDQFLCEVARRIREAVRAVDTVARIGGDEFTVILERIERPYQAEDVAAKIRLALAEPLALGGQAINVSSSIGIAIYPEDGDSPEALVRSADEAMFYAKEQGRDRVQRFNETLSQRMSSRVLVETELLKAVAGGQLRLHYQPQYSGHDGRLVGVEALVRWQHPERGLVWPAEFIQVAEDCGAIHQLGSWVLHEACRQGRRWHDRGHSLRMAVNLSTRQLGQPGFVAELERVLEQSGFAPASLELEITEGALMVDPDVAIERLHAIRDLGVHVAIDDFGTGFSSLSRLRRLPISRLKIDGSFVRGIPHNADDRSIALAIISMAHDLSLEVISEGVETAAQRAFLENSRCDLLQGFWLARPGSAEQVARLLLEPCGNTASAEGDSA